jgi:3-methyladenine DNA glycosylase AlkD
MNPPNPAIAEHSMRFFETGKGEYGEGDQFLGVSVPVIRAVARKNSGLSLSQILGVLTSPYHEERLLSLILLVNVFQKSGEDAREQIYQAYLDNTASIIGWDLVDSSAHQIVGGYLIDKDRRTLSRLAGSRRLWERRISMIATYHFIKQNQYDDTLEISRQLLNDEEDLFTRGGGVDASRSRKSQQKASVV